MPTHTSTCRPDKYETIQAVAFVQQLLTHGGFYDDHLEFIRVQRVQVVASIVPGTSAGRSQLSKRLTARLRIAVMGYPDQQQLEAIYTRMLGQVGADCLAVSVAWCTCNLVGWLCRFGRALWHCAWPLAGLGCAAAIALQST